MKLDKKKDLLLILGIPRGGVVVADIIASKPLYDCEFDMAMSER